MNRRVFTRCIATTLTAHVTLGTLGIAAQAKVIHVRKAAPGPVHDGSSWERAFTTVSGALAASSNLDEVWVAEGTYPERIELRYGVGLYGGFAGTETGRDQRDPDAHVTTLDGERKGTVVVARANAVNTVVDGFHVANGMREERTWYGPGYVTETGQAGGGIFCEHAPTLFANLVIRDCAGYGLDCRGESTVTLRDSTVRDCENAGIHCADSLPVITHNAISGNGTQFASGMYLYAISAFRSTVTIANNIVTGNGEGVLLVDSRGALTSNTIADNPEGIAALYNLPIQHGTPAELTIVNNILAFN